MVFTVRDAGGAAGVMDSIESGASARPARARQLIVGNVE